MAYGVCEATPYYGTVLFNVEAALFISEIALFISDLLIRGQFPQVRLRLAIGMVCLRPHFPLHDF